MKPHMKRLVLEAFIYLGWARILKALPFSKVAPSLGTKMAESSYDRDAGNQAVLLDVSRAIHMVSRRTWWESKCLVTAIAAMKMLERRKIDSTLYMGVTKDASGKMIAHAWLRSSNIYLTGADEKDKFTVVAVFGKIIHSKGVQRSTIHG
ncbi:lasso peptide biosynthesis B2 protein [Paenibacillus spongiae]|uniref:Lasso peptide biosynthesis B2 protein n=1 Tax=Paenibacillus spongiae TaxID=2909671 RepID=A0ABY5SD74_9BACL|nr:lasso peptide biosynthesis B2 protein [Paenibacillus spongiae]UVI31619.1 lasso peptide biosynthesis B2 protein [Paenibacillus spongiae]